MLFPRMIDVRQHFDVQRVDDPAQTVRDQMQTLELAARTKPGESVAVTAGSRGIANIVTILREAVTALKAHDLKPFVVPAMGSHAGGTAEGQAGMLRNLGITEESVGAPIRATMETVVVSQTATGIPVHFDKFAAEADHVLICNRVKPHTGFVGPIESGLHKMMLIGLGKHAGAKIYHRAILTHSFPEIIEAVGDQVLQKCKVLGGLAIVENAEDDTALIEAVMPAMFRSREPELLKIAKDWLPRLPFDEVDLLIIDRIGKNISGTGLDTNVVGRKFVDHAATEMDSVSCRRILVRSLTPESHGNATGIGIAEFTTDACVAQINREITNINCVTGLHPEAGMLPMSYPTDREAIATALQTIGLIEPPDAKVVQIRDTLHLTRVRVSEAFADQIRGTQNLAQLGDPAEMSFDDEGRLADIPSG